MVEDFKLEDTTDMYIEYRFYGILSMSTAENPSHGYREQQNTTYNKLRMKEPLPFSQKIRAMSSAAHHQYPDSCPLLLQSQSFLLILLCLEIVCLQTVVY